MPASGRWHPARSRQSTGARKSGEAAGLFYDEPKRRIALVIGVLICRLGMSATPARALDRLCDPSHEDCRAILINYISNETSASTSASGSWKTRGTRPS